MVDLPDTMVDLPDTMVDISDTMVDLLDTTVDCPDTMVNLPDTMVDLSDTMVDLPDTMVEQGFGSWQISSSEWKKDWEHQCALISQNMLSKTNTFNFYRKKSLNTFFWMKILFFL